MMTLEEFGAAISNWQITTLASAYKEAQLRDTVAQAAAYGVTLDHDKLVACVKRLSGGSMLSTDEAIETVTTRLMAMIQDGRGDEALDMLEAKQ